MSLVVVSKVVAFLGSQFAASDVFSAGAYRLMSKAAAQSDNTGAYFKIGLDQTLASSTLGALTSNDFVVPADGLYEVSAGVNYAANATGIRACLISVNDFTGDNPIATEGVSDIKNAASAGRTNLNACSAVLSLSANDTISLYGKQTSGVALNVEAGAWMSVTRLDI